MAANSHARQLPAFLQQSKAGGYTRIAIFLSRQHTDSIPDVHAKFVDLEWQQRDRLLQGTQRPVNASDPPSKWSRLSGDTILARNRYLNVEPFAQNRVKLRVAEGINDYINASPIRLGKRRYIATQGPKDTNVNHFYRMVAEEVGNPAVVVMLTQTHESGREKCFQYYPLSTEESPLVIPPDEEIADGFEGKVELQSVEQDAASRSEIRRLRLRTSTADGQQQDKRINHLLFSGWPDFLIPEGDDRQALIELIRLSASLNRKASSDTKTAHTNGTRDSLADALASTDQDNPRIIHCSAGVGRSGTFIALDYLLSLLHTGQLDNVPANKDPIAETVDQLRMQRMMMVQGESQFHFLYEALREQFLARLA